jgi:hypothetical protein
VAPPLAPPDWAKAPPLAKSIVAATPLASHFRTIATLQTKGVNKNCAQGAAKSIDVLIRDKVPG